MGNFSKRNPKLTSSVCLGDSEHSWRRASSDAGVWAQWLEYCWDHGCTFNCKFVPLAMSVMGRRMERSRCA